MADGARLVLQRLLGHLELDARDAAVVALRAPAYVHPWQPPLPDDANVARAFASGVVGSRGAWRATSAPAPAVAVDASGWRTAKRVATTQGPAAPKTSGLGANKQRKLPVSFGKR